ncbi:MAG TPA: hypothetical protein VMU06_09635 [Stellaceae bacterium]|nr:hypothetical protein [Stellaceae bacterium]
MPTDLALFYVFEEAKTPFTLAELEHDAVLTHEADETSDVQ